MAKFENGITGYVRGVYTAEVFFHVDIRGNAHINCSQCYTDYSKYSYDSITAQDIEASRYFTAATEEDVEEILLYIENFEAWVEAVGGELKDNYDFDKTNVSEGDFFYIETKYGEPIGERTYGKFENYTVFYFDVDAQVFYYFYNNI